MKNPTKVKVGASRISLIGLGLAASISAALAQVAKPIAVGKSLVDGNIQIEVEELRRKGDGTVMLKFAVVNHSARDVQATLLGIPTLTDVHLVDLVNRRQYEVGGNLTSALSSSFNGVKAESRTDSGHCTGRRRRASRS